MTNKNSEQLPIYLTFDDGPHPEFTPRILDLLDLFQVSVTFFVLGGASAQHPSLVRSIVEHGHSIGNHTVNHCNPWLISESRARREVREAHDTIADICGEAPRWFRPPYGRKRRAMLEEATALGMQTVFWDRSAIDWGLLASIDSIGHRLSRVQAGEIILCHDAPLVKNRPDMTLAILPAFIKECLGRGLRFAGLDERCPAASQRESGRARSLSTPQSV